MCIREEIAFKLPTPILETNSVNIMPLISIDDDHEKLHVLGYTGATKPI